MKDYIFTIILVLCIIGVVAGIVKIFMCFEEDSGIDLSNRNIQTNQVENLSEIKKTKTNKNEGTNYIKEDDSSKTENDSSEKEDNEEILKQIVDKYNSSEATKEMISSGYSLRAILNGNKIVVVTSGAGLSFKQIFYLNENILSTTIEKNVVDNREIVIRILLANTLLDSVAQAKGHPQRKLTNALLSEESKNYNIEREGVQIMDSDPIEMKIDVSKDFNFLNDL